MGSWDGPSGLAAGAWAAPPSCGPAGEEPGRRRTRPAVRVAAATRAAARGVRRMAVLLREDGEGDVPDVADERGQSVQGGEVPSPTPHGPPPCPGLSMTSWPGCRCNGRGR